MKTISNRVLASCVAVLAGLQISALGQTLIHRYSFTSDASDSVGGAHGTPMNGVTFVDGQAVLDNPLGYDSSNPDGKYIDLPDGIMGTRESITFEIWLTPTIGDQWARIIDFGDNTGKYLFLATGNYTIGPEAQGIAPGVSGNWLRSRNTLMDGLENHIVLTINGPNKLAKIYLNGELVEVKYDFTNTPALLGLTTNNYLGRSQWGGDDYLVGMINEFRIYDGALDQLRVKANYLAGPDAAPPTPNVTNIEFRINFPFYVGFSRPVGLYAYAEGLTDPVDISDSPAVTYTVEDPTVLQISSAGIATGLKAGTTKITATYGSLSVSQTVQVLDQSAVLRHRYSFTTDASDSVSGMHGYAFGNVQFVGGQVVLDGSEGTFVDLPPNLIAPTNIPHSAVTFEAWVSLSPQNGAWTRILDFGNTVGGNGSKCIFLSPNTEASGGVCRLAVSDATPGWRAEDQVSAQNLLGQTNVHVVVVYNPNPNRGILALYINGELAGQNRTFKPLDTLNNVYSYLGRSTYTADAYLNGAINEFRIWSGELTPFQVAINSAVGPDAIGPSDPGTLQRVRLVVTTSMIKGAIQNAKVYADFSAVTNVNVTRELGTVYQSSNPLVVTVDTNGVITAVGPGTATVTATYGTMSDSKTITVTVAETRLKHRWSFNETSGDTVADSVGGKHGTLMNGAYFTGTGEAVMNGGYVELPGGLITNCNQVTIETWVTVSSTEMNSSDARLFVFGGSHGQNEIGLTARSGDNNVLVRTFGLPNITVVRGGHIAIDKKVHVVAIFNEAANMVQLYIDGALENYANATFSLASLSNAISRLAGNISGDVFTYCSFDEFRIYEGALTPYQIAVSKAAGPDNPILDPGVPQSVTLKVDKIMMPGMRRLAHVIANYAQVSNVRLRSDMEEVVLSSSNPNVVRVASGGWLEAVAPGTAEINVNVKGRTDTETVMVVEKQVAILHRYSFTEDASDSIGAQDGLLGGAPTISDGKVLLLGDANNKAGGYIELPPGLVSCLDAVTFEMWVDLGVQGNWARVFDFGDHTLGGSQNGISYIFLTRPWAATPTRLVLSDGVASASEVVLDAPFSLEGFVGQVVAVLDPPNNQMRLYTNGALAATGTMNNKRLSGVRDVKCWIGRSLYAADAGLYGSIDEFRIYAGALSPADIAANYAAGPNVVRASLLPVARPILSVKAVGNNIQLAWPEWAGDFTLESTPSLPASTWTVVSGTRITNDSIITITLPITGTQQYYRLRK